MSAGDTYRKKSVKFNEFTFIKNGGMSSENV